MVFKNDMKQKVNGYETLCDCYIGQSEDGDLSLHKECVLCITTLFIVSKEG